ncbi:alpha/beta hydrolase fold-domain-containing protein [Pyrenochaeta sp. MPI-SDFR-AT-0127]|nr:alpha/beta hydrolase fold-domain-containing protein [Pyrenochaeta sp. MPI-SDFR-AT-0127]
MMDVIGPAPGTVSETQIQIPIPNTDWTSRAVVCRPASANQGPLIVLYHGGGFAMSHPEGMLPYARGFAQLFNAVVVCPSFHLAPEHSFPIGVNDAYDILKWCAQNAKFLNADVTQGFLVGGNSAGANFAAVLARRSVEDGLEPALTGQWLGFPALGHHDLAKDGVKGLVQAAKKYEDIWGLSWVQNKDAALINDKAVSALYSLYKPDYTSPLYNPLAANPQFDVGRLPKAFVQVAGMDIMRDDGIVYAYALEDAGVSVTLLAYPGTPHTFPDMYPTLEVSRKALVDNAKGIAWLLGVGVEEVRARKAMLRKT